MDRSSKIKNSPKLHINAIFQDYEASTRVLQTLTNLSNTVIETALSGQYKFLLEIFQNADDAFDEQSKNSNIKMMFILLDNYFIIQHNGKAFDYYDVERICDYASQIGEVKANDLSKTGYKGLGFKSLFNLSECIYICSNGYSFRFDKNYWPDSDKKPWQVIPIWSEDLPLSENCTYDQPVNIILKVKDKELLNNQLKELSNHSEVLLYLHRVNCVCININGMEHALERKVERIGLFHKIVLLKNQHAESTWLSRIYEQTIPSQLKKCIQEVSQFIYPDKIKSAKEVAITFTLCTNEVLENVLKINGFCFSTLPTQLQLSLPYHVNSLFILNLDRTQFHENEWNEFLVNKIGYLQLNFLKDLAEMPHLKNFVIELLVRKINHIYNVFNGAFLKGLEEAKKEIEWIPTYKGCLLKLGEVCVDKIHFFKQNFQNIRDKLCESVIDYDVRSPDLLSKSEAKTFDYDSLFDQFSQKYYPQLTENSYMKFLSYIYEISQKFPLGSSKNKLVATPFLKTKNKTLASPKNALLEVENNPIPDFAESNPVDNKYLPINDTNLFKNWLVNLGATRLGSPVSILRKSVFHWMYNRTLPQKMTIQNHKAIIGYLAKNFEQFTYQEIEILKENLIILTESNDFKIATSCYLPNAIVLQELGDIMSDNEVISSCYDICSLKRFLYHLGISERLSSIEIFRKCILVWINNCTMESKLTIENYKPIIEFLSSEYRKIMFHLTKDDKETLRCMPVLTCTGIFSLACFCYFDTAIPYVKDFEDVIRKHSLVETQNLSNDVSEFLSDIGVQKTIDPTYVIRNTVLEWIKNGTMQSKININNHYDIIKYIADNLNLCAFQYREKEALKKLPVLTKSNSFRDVCSCFWQTTSAYEYDKDIPKLESIIPDNELVSSDYYANEKVRPSSIEKFLNDLGVRHLKFVDIFDKYCNYLTDLESIEWFFSNLVKQWKEYQSYYNSNKQILNNVKVKLESSPILSKNGNLYTITEFYSPRFFNMYSIDNNAVPLLAFENLPKDLEKFLSIRQELDLPCIMKLLEALDKKENLGEDVTLIFFKTLLEQLLLKNKAEIKNYPLKLLSNDNKLTLVKDLYYFKEEDAICFANSHYLKRIYGMSHNDTLKLAELCGVNVLLFNQEVNYGDEKPTYDKSLREFYLERLPLIVLQESKILNESPEVVLKKLIPKVCSIKLYKCNSIMIKYPFGKPVETCCYFDLLNIYVVGKWMILRTEIHEHIKVKLGLISNISKILDLESVAEDKKHWLYFQKENPEKLLVVEEEQRKLLPNQNID